MSNPVDETTDNEVELEDEETGAEHVDPPHYRNRLGQVIETRVFSEKYSESHEKR